MTIKFPRQLQYGLLLTASLALSVSCTSAPTISVTGAVNQERFSSIDEANKALADASGERARIEARFVEDERACYPRFFTTRCLDAAKQEHHLNLEKVKQSEIAARQFVRRTRADEHEQALVQKRLDTEEDAGQREKKRTAESASKTETNQNKLPVH